MNNGLSIDELVREFARKREFDEIVSGRRRLGCSDIASPRQSVDEIMLAYENLSVVREYRKLEVSGLRWGDCDFENNIIEINHNLVYNSRGDEGGSEARITTPKTKAGVRIIPMFSEVRRALLEEVDNQIMALTDDEEDATPALDEFIESIEKNFDFHLNRRR